MTDNERMISFEHYTNMVNDSLDETYFDNFKLPSYADDEWLHATYDMLNDDILMRLDDVLRDSHAMNCEYILAIPANTGDRDDYMEPELASHVITVLTRMITQNDNGKHIIDVPNPDSMESLMTCLQLTSGTAAGRELHDDMITAAKHNDYSIMIAMSRVDEYEHSQEYYESDDFIGFIRAHAELIRKAGKDYGLYYSHSDPEYIGIFNQMNDNTSVSMQWMRMMVKAYDYIDTMREWGAMRVRNATDALELMIDERIMSAEEYDMMDDDAMYCVFDDMFKMDALYENMDALIAFMFLIKLLSHIPQLNPEIMEYYSNMLNDEHMMRACLHDVIRDGYPVEYAIEHVKMEQGY